MLSRSIAPSVWATGSAGVEAATSRCTLSSTCTIQPASNAGPRRNGNALLNSNQGYENVEDAEKVARRLFGPVVLTGAVQTVALRVEYRSGKTKTEQLR